MYQCQFRHFYQFTIGFLLVCFTSAVSGLITVAKAEEVLIRQNLSKRIPQMNRIDEIRSTPMPGLFEIRIGTDIFYSDSKGNFLIQGELIDTRIRRNITEDRIKQLTAVQFNDLPFNGAFTITKGNGERKLAVFEDPNCGYCKHLERELQNIDNVTIYVFLYPILSADSAEKSRNIWCSADRTQAWLDYMLKDKAASAATCPIDDLRKNLEFGQKHKITGTPTILFGNGQRVSGAMNAQQLEQRLAMTPAEKVPNK